MIAPPIGCLREAEAEAEDNIIQKSEEQYTVEQTELTEQLHTEDINNNEK